MSLEDLSPKDVRKLSDKDLIALTQELVLAAAEDRKETGIRYFVPSQEPGYEIFETTARIIGVGGGNRSGKTENVLAFAAALATGVFPDEPRIRAACEREFRGPIKSRVVLESLTSVLHPIMLPKLKWWVWTGLPPSGGEKGHWGWIPKDCLKGSWDKSWSEKLRTLTVKCRSPETGEELGDSIIQFMSFDQDWSDFASGTFELIMIDEPPPYMIWKENLARTLDVNGRVFLAMTWPDDPAIPVDWIYDEIYDKKDDPNIAWIELDTLENRYLDRKGVEAQTANWSETTKLVKLKGQPIRFSNRVHPLFTDTAQWWCFDCKEPAGEEICQCGAPSFAYCHVREFETGNWPTIFGLDPHPRKAHMFLWAQIDPNDDIWVVADGECKDETGETKLICDEIELQYNLSVARRLIDPNMGRSPASARNREITWQDEFADAGLWCDLADDSDVGRKRLNEYLKPDPDSHAPRVHIHPRCVNTISQLKRYVWDDFKVSLGKDIKQKPRAKNDDYPTLLKYILNSDPNFRWLAYGAPIVGRRRRA